MVIELAEGADVAKFTEFVNASPLAALKEGAAPECPKTVGGKLVWYSKNFKLPAQNKERADTFSVAHGEVAEDQLLCIVVCPDLAVRRISGNGNGNGSGNGNGNGKGYEVLADYCKGCGLCVRECPTGSMTMVEERR